MYKYSGYTPMQSEAKSDEGGSLLWGGEKSKLICLQGRVVFSSSTTEDFKCPFLLLAEVEVKLYLKDPVIAIINERGEAAILCVSEGYGELPSKWLHSLGFVQG